MSFYKFSRASFVRFIGHAFFVLIALGGLAWLLGAMSVHLSGAAFYAVTAAVVAASALSCWGRVRQRRRGWLGLAVIAVLAGLWYQGIAPSQDRDWAVDVEHGVTAEVSGDIVELSNVRDFVWQNSEQAKTAWEARTVNLDQLASVDMITSVWDNPDIAHVLVSFGFSDGQRIVFSVETRKEADEEFSVKGGFFRQFELILVAATENDIVKLRTNYRHEDVRLYPVRMSAEKRRELFLSYVELARKLQDQPAFYNTLTANCTTTVYRLAQTISPDMRLDWRVVFSGHLPSYVDALGGFEGVLPIDQRIAQAGITQKALSYDGPNYSAGIRRADPAM